MTDKEVKSEQEVNDGTSVMAEVWITIASLDCFSQTDASGEIWFSDDSGLLKEESDADTKGCSAEAKVCVEVHRRSFYEVVKGMDNVSSSKENDTEFGSSPKAKVFVDIHMCSLKLSSGNRQCSCE